MSLGDLLVATATPKVASAAQPEVFSDAMSHNAIAPSHNWVASRTEALMPISRLHWYPHAVQKPYCLLPIDRLASSAHRPRTTAEIRSRGWGE